MSDVFPKWINRLPRKLALAALVAGTGIVTCVGYYFTPKYTLAGYRPIQPVAFSHKSHSGQVGTDCRYCHNSVEKSWFANLPATSICMNCHEQILKDDPRLALVRESSATGVPIAWVQVQKLPDFTCFNHAAHVDRGVGCADCHGRVDQMDQIQAQPMTMAFCLDCHRNPAQHLRSLNKITQMDWQAPNASAQSNQAALSPGAQMVRDWKIKTRESCSACHR